MKTLTLSLTAMALIAGSTIALAADVGERQERRNPRNGVAHRDSKTTGTTVRASELIGHNIENSQGESVGEISDIVLNVRNGKLRYVAVTYGGFLGLGDKLFAVPYEAFTCRPDPEDPDETLVVLEVTQKQLEGVTGFDPEDWPNFADKKFTDELDQRYGIDRVQRTPDRRRGRGISVNVSKDGIDVNVGATRDRHDD